MNQNYKELLKMYQFLIEENNELKKEVYVLKKANLGANLGKNDSFIAFREESTLKNSDYKPKSIT